MKTRKPKTKPLSLAVTTIALGTSFVGVFIITYLYAIIMNVEPITNIGLVTFIINIVLANVAVLGIISLCIGVALSILKSKHKTIITFLIVVGGIVFLCFQSHLTKLGAIILGMS